MGSVPSNDYWRERAEARMDAYVRDSYSTLRTLSNAHQKALDGIREDIERIYGNFARWHGLTEDEARTYLSQPVSEEEHAWLLREIEEVQDPRIRMELIAQSQAPAYQYRMSRLERLQGSIHAQVGKLADLQLSESTELFRRTIHNAYGRAIFDLQQGSGYGFAVDRMSTGAVEQLLRTDWSGLHYSERIWKNAQALNEWLQEDLLAGMLRGKSVDALAEQLVDSLGTGLNEAERLVDTEMTYFAGQAEMAGYRKVGIDRYIYMSEHQKITCKRCLALDNVIFPVEEAEPGENMEPMHPHCHCTTGAWYDDLTMEDFKRRATDPVTGAVTEIPNDMTFEEWEASYLNPSTRAAAQAKQRKEAFDRKQFERYQEALPSQMPKSFKAFRRVKYENEERYKEWMADYRRAMRAAAEPEK